jgi:putative oxidoreductase
MSHDTRTTRRDSRRQGLVAGLFTAKAPAALSEGVHLVLRLVLALVFFAHGWDTVQNLGVAGTIDLQRASGVPLPEVAGPFTVYVELVGAPMLALGLATRPVAAALTGLMVGAIVFIHAPYGIFVENGGYELVLVLGAASALFAVGGSGRYGADGVVAARRARTSSNATAV